MAANPQCSALASAKDKSGLSYAQIAGKIGKPEQRVIDICTGKATPTAAEYTDLAVALKITDPVPHNASHPAT